MDKYVFKMFSIIGWSFENLYKKLKQGYSLYKDFIQAIKDFIEKQSVVKWTQDKLLELDKFLQQHPKTKRIAGIALGALLIYIWFNITFTGDINNDFDIKSIIDAFLGKISLADIFGGVNGLAMITLLTTGLLFKLSFPWPGPSTIKFIFAIIFTLGKKLHMKIKQQNKNKIEREIEEV